MDMALSHWSASWPVLLGYAVVAATHLAGLTGTLASATPAPPAALSAAATRRDLKREAVVFQAGLLIAVLALLSPIGYWSAVYIWVRSIQDLMLAFVAPALIAVGAPWISLGHYWPWHAGSQLGGSAGGGRAGGGRAGGGPAGGGSVESARVPWWLARPVAAVVAFNVIWLSWHLPVAYDLARANSGLGVAEHVTYLAAGIVFWLQLIGSRPYSPSAVPLRRAALLLGTVLAGTVLGMMLVFGSGVLYPVYGGGAHHVMTVIDDQQLAGAVLWMGMLPTLIIAAIAILLRWLGDEEASELSTDLDRLLTRQRSTWPSRPGWK